MHVYIGVVLRNCTQIYICVMELQKETLLLMCIFWMCVSSLGHRATYPAEENKNHLVIFSYIYKHLTNMTSTPFQLKIRN